MGAYISREPIFDPPDDDEVYDEVQRRVDAVVDAAIKWRQSDDVWDDSLERAVDALLELREPPKEGESRNETA